jgi:hypothetical protein
MVRIFSAGAYIKHTSGGVLQSFPRILIDKIKYAMVKIKY